MFCIILVMCTDGFIRGFFMKSPYYFILLKHLTNNYETRSVSFSHEEILSHSLSFCVKRVYRPETYAHGQCEFLEKLNMGHFTTRFLKSLCALFFREESGKPNDLQRQKTLQTWRIKPHSVVQNSCKLIKTPKKPEQWGKTAAQEQHRRPHCKRERSQPLQNDGTLQEYPPVTSAASCRVQEHCSILNNALEQINQGTALPCVGPWAELVAVGCCVTSMSYGWVAAAAVTSQALLPGVWCSVWTFWHERRTVDLEHFVKSPSLSLAWVVLWWTQHLAGPCP